LPPLEALPDDPAIFAGVGKLPVVKISLMKKLKRIFLVVGIGAVVLLIVAVMVVALCLDGIVKKGVETIGPQITKVSINLDSIHIGLLTSSASVKGLVVGNPESFKAPDAIKIGLAKVGVNPFSILSDKIVVRSIRVESPEITFEGGLGGNNLSKIMDNVNGVAKAGGPPSANTNTTAKAGEKPAKKIEVDDFLITGAKVHGTLILFSGKEVTIPSMTLPDIHLTNLGKGGDGLTPTDLSHAVLKAIISATVKAVGDATLDIGKGGGNLGKDAVEGVDKIKKGIGGLFGK
jgi:hypothetical protein